MASRAKAAAGIAVMGAVLLVWSGVGWYAITLVLAVLGITGTSATTITVIGEVAFLVLAISVMRLAFSAQVGRQ